jgi:cellulose synthase/poly-beta-1,6-N-acetylglucosamine synthase-like glycosyltransferase
MEQNSMLMEPKIQILLPSENKSDVVRLRTELPVTVIIPAYNEENTISQTLDSLKNQTGHVEQIIVVDDYSTDKTGQIAAQYDGVTVLRPPSNTGSKAGAQTFALPNVTSKYTIAIDADTSLEPDAIEKMVKFMDLNPETAAASSFVLPKKARTLWERGRYLEYMFVFTFTKKIQEWYGKPLISSGCFSIYNTEELKKIGGWNKRTLAEDVDLTWTLYENGKVVRYNHEIYCYPLEPENLDMMSKQLRRWSHGYLQNVKLHWKRIKRVPVIREQIIVSMSDSVFGPLALFVVLPVISILLHNPLLIAFAFLTDALFISIPPLVKSIKMKNTKMVLGSIPSYFVLRTVNAFFFWSAFMKEFVLNKSFHMYEKGH